MCKYTDKPESSPRTRAVHGTVPETGPEDITKNVGMRSLFPLTGDANRIKSQIKALEDVGRAYIREFGDHSDSSSAEDLLLGYSLDHRRQRE